MNNTNNQSQFYISDEMYKTISPVFLSDRHEYLYGSVRYGIPDNYFIKENGSWIYTNEMMYDIYSPAKFYEKIIEWMIDDINNNYLANYYNLLREYPSFIDFCNQKIKSADFINIDVDDIIPEIYQWCLYALNVYPKY